MKAKEEKQDSGGTLQHSTYQNKSNRITNPGEILQAMSRVLINDFMMEENIEEAIDMEEGKKSSTYTRGGCYRIGKQKEENSRT